VSRKSAASIAPVAQTAVCPQGVKLAGETCRRVLVVEDNPITQLIALEQLKRLNCVAFAVSTGFAALEASQAETFDLILMDCGLPYLDGFETVRAIREHERDAQRKRVAIVAITANTDDECVDKCMRAGMDGYFSKPISMAELHGLLTRFL
jgi:CheY-like chemotaxis protein